MSNVPPFAFAINSLFRSHRRIGTHSTPGRWPGLRAALGIPASYDPVRDRLRREGQRTHCFFIERLAPGQAVARVSPHRERFRAQRVALRIGAVCLGATTLRARSRAASPPAGSAAREARVRQRRYRTDRGVANLRDGRPRRILCERHAGLGTATLPRENGGVGEHGCAARVAERNQPRRGPARPAGLAREDGLS